MEFGKTSKYKEVNYELGEDRFYVNINKCLKAHHTITDEDQDQIGRIYVGTPTWSEKEWEGLIYPPGTKSANYLYYYSRAFNCIELNATHYALPRVERVLEWKKLVNVDFKFCPKVPQKVSHGGLIREKSYWNEFIKTMMLLEDNLGGVFLQLSDKFSIDEINSLKNFLHLIPKGMKLSIELRHGSFYLKQKLKDEVADLLSSKKVSCVITDTAGRRDIVHSSHTSDIALVRFIGNNDKEIDRLRLEEWKYKIASWFDQGIKDLYFFIHEPNNTQAIFTAQEWVKDLNQSLETQLNDPISSADIQKQLDLF